MNPFEFWKEVYLIFGDNFSWNGLSNWDDETGLRLMRQDIGQTWGWGDESPEYGTEYYMIFVKDDWCELTDKFWKELEASG